MYETEAPASKKAQPNCYRQAPTSSSAERTTPLISTISLAVHDESVLRRSN